MAVRVALDRRIKWTKLNKGPSAMTVVLGFSRRPAAAKLSELFRACPGSWVSSAGVFRNLLGARQFTYAVELRRWVPTERMNELLTDIFGEAGDWWLIDIMDSK